MLDIIINILLSIALIAVAYNLLQLIQRTVAKLHKES